MTCAIVLQKKKDIFFLHSLCEYKHLLSGIDLALSTGYEKFRVLFEFEI